MATTNGDIPAMMPCRATTKPSAQQKAAPAPQRSPIVVECLSDWGMVREGVAVTMRCNIVASRRHPQSMKACSWASPNAKFRSFQRVDIGRCNEFQPARGGDVAALQPHHMG